MTRWVWRSGIHFVLAAAGAISLSGCGDTPRDTAEPLSEARAELWSDPDFVLWPSHSATVCWDGALANAPEHAAFRANARAWVEQYIARVTDFRFQGWGTCPAFTFDPGSGTYLDGQGTIAVSLDESAFGSFGGVAYPPLAWTTYGYQSGGPTQLVFDPTAYDGGGGRGYVLHEFMHAIGFSHEFNRDENWPPVCVLGVPTEGGTEYTPFDPASITMYSYCDGMPDVLSPWDIVGLQNAYGRKPTGSTVGLRDNCIFTSNTISNSLVRTGNCIGTDPDVGAAQRERWQRNSSNKLFLPTSPSTQLTIASGNFIRVFSSGTSWSFNSSELRGVGDKCVAPQGGSLVAGAILEITTCTGAAAQKWRMSVSSQGVTLRSGSLCWEVAGGAVALHTPIQLGSCSGAARQTFSPLNEGGLANGGLCVDSQWGDPTDGRTLQLYTCKWSNDWSRHNQRFYLHGPISNGASCLQFNGGSGTLLTAASCNGSAEQRWDYHY